MIYLCFDVLLFFNIHPYLLQNMQNIHTLISILYLEDAQLHFNIVYFDDIKNSYHRHLITNKGINQRLLILSWKYTLFFECLIRRDFLVIYYFM